MWARRDFVVAMPIEELRVAHQDTLLGNVWHLGNPLLTTAVYYLVFGVLLGVDRGVDNFILWLMVGVFAFGLTSRTMLGGATAITSNRGLMRAIRFPGPCSPVSVVISRLLTFGFQLAVLAVVAVATGEGISRRWWCCRSSSSSTRRSTSAGRSSPPASTTPSATSQQIIPFIFRLLAYMSGVMFPIDKRLATVDIPPISHALNLNPIVPMLNMYRWVFLGDPVGLRRRAVRDRRRPASLLAFGFWFFRAAEQRYGRA